MAKQKRIFEIAKDLGVDSKAIVAKCHAEGIPVETVKNHMSTISAGLEQTIREWFTQHDTSGGTATAIETSEKVDLDQVRTKAPRRKKASSKDEGGDTAATTTVTVDAPADAPSEPIAAPMPAVTPTAPTAAPVAPSEVKAQPVTPAVEVKARKIEPTISTQPASTITATPTPSPTQAPAPAAIPMPQPTQVERPAAAASRPTDVAAQGPEGPGGGAGTATPTRNEPSRPPVRPNVPVKPAPMNVPLRPTGVSPAGPKLEVRAPVKLSGPKVVRVEAPEVLAPPRPRVNRPMGPGGPSGPMGPRPGGPGMMPGGGGGDDDRRNARRGGGAGAAAAKRSSGQGVPDRRRGRSGAEWSGSTQGIFSEQDLIEREARLARAGGFLKKRKQDLKKPGQPAAQDAAAEGRIRVTAPFTIKDLSASTGVKASEITKKLFMQGIMLKINDPIAVEKAVEIMMDFDIELEVVEARTAEETVSDQFAKREAKDQRQRGPVVTILGHVDHGKTSLLDKIRNANVAAGEAGGITQKTSAFVAEVEVENNKRQVVFLDTPGHEAFTSMRARGAKMTDVVVLVVSAPEGVMPQTVESINHAKAAKVPIVVALNKIDRPDATEAQVQKTLGELAKAGLNPAEWGGDTEVVRTSAVTGKGIDELLTALDYQAQLLELKADFDGAAQGTVIEAKMEEGRGAVASILIQQGKLKVGDFIVMGRSFGKVRDITDDKGKRVREAMPPMPVQVSGIDVVCDAGDKFFVTANLKQAEEAAEQRRQRERHTALAAPKLTLDSLFSQMQTAQGGESAVKEIRIILKTDQQGTVDVLKGECEKIATPEVKTRVIHAAVGGITESDVLLADASKAIIIGFNVIPSGKARQLSEAKGVEIRTYQVIYDITDDLKKAAEGMLAPEVREEVLGHAEVRAVFKVTKVGNIAGCYITDGQVQRDALIRVTRNGVVVEHDRKLAQLKRHKDDAKEVRAGMECGMKIDGYDDIKEGDVLECYRKVEFKRTLAGAEAAKK
ncbi:MAG TPA: translation initiation factor IF-2 [Phycisphaerales bacterium]|nr:translation initiation factor IF-2 [Phycisphaerales bacterium]